MSKLISESPDTHRDLDPSYSYYYAKKCTYARLPTIITIINLSLASGVLPDEFKSSSVQSLLKKSNSDKMNCQISDLSLILISFLSKLTARIVESRLADFSTEHSHLNSF
jgi:hypothetical protein